MNKKYSRIPCFVEMKIKTTNKICGISKTESVVFYYKYLHLPLLSSQYDVSQNPFVFQNSLLLNCPKPHQHDSKPTRIQNSN